MEWIQVSDKRHPRMQLSRDHYRLPCSGFTCGSPDLYLSSDTSDEDLRPMGAARRITISLPEDIVRAADKAAHTQASTRSALFEDALRWYLRIQELPDAEATPEELEAIERGRAEIARGEFVTFEEIKRDLEADLLKKRTKKSESFST
jgi:predicted transcriptional regulator